MLAAQELAGWGDCDGAERRVWDGVERRVWDGAERRVWDGAERRVWDGEANVARRGA